MWSTATPWAVRRRDELRGPDAFGRLVDVGERLEGDGRRSCPGSKQAPPTARVAARGAAILVEDDDLGAAGTGAS